MAKTTAAPEGVMVLPDEGWQDFYVISSARVTSSYGPQLKLELQWLSTPTGQPVNLLVWLSLPKGVAGTGALRLDADVALFVAACLGKARFEQGDAFDDEVDPVHRKFQGDVMHYTAGEKAKPENQGKPRWRFQGFRPLDDAIGEADAARLRAALVARFTEANARDEWTKLSETLFGAALKVNELKTSQAQQVWQALGPATVTADL